MASFRYTDLPKELRLRIAEFAVLGDMYTRRRPLGIGLSRMSLDPAARRLPVEIKPEFALLQVNKKINSDTRDHVYSRLAVSLPLVALPILLELPFTFPHQYHNSAQLIRQMTFSIYLSHWQAPTSTCLMVGRDPGTILRSFPNLERVTVLLSVDRRLKPVGQSDVPDTHVDQLWSIARQLLRLVPQGATFDFVGGRRDATVTSAIDPRLMREVMAAVIGGGTLEQTKKTVRKGLEAARALQD